MVSSSELVGENSRRKLEVASREIYYLLTNERDELLEQEKYFTYVQTRLETEVSKLMNQLGDADAMLAKLQGNLENEQSESANLRNEVAELEEKLGVANTSITKFQGDLGNEQSESSKLSIKVAELEEKLGVANTSFTKLQEQFETKQSESDKLRNKVGELRKDLDVANTSSTKLEKQFKTKQSESAELRNKVDELKKELDVANKNSIKLQGDFKQKAARLEDANATLRTERDNFEKVAARLSEELGDEKAASSKFKKEVAEKERRNQPYQMSLLCCFLMILAYYGLGWVVCGLLYKKFSNMEKGSIVINGIYFMVTTSFTIGFGDIAPKRVLAKLITCMFVMSGVHAVNCLTVFENHLWTKMKTKYLSDVSGIRRSVIIHVLAVIAVFASIGIGMLGIFLCENGTALDAFYLANMALSTEGFGDKSFKTIAGRGFAAIWLLIFQPLYASTMKFLMDSLVLLIQAYC